MLRASKFNSPVLFLHTGGEVVLSAYPEVTRNLQHSAGSVPSSKL
jgi:hypothetical protein